MPRIDIDRKTSRAIVDGVIWNENRTGCAILIVARRYCQCAQCDACLVGRAFLS